MQHNIEKMVKLVRVSMMFKGGVHSKLLQAQRNANLPLPIHICLGRAASCAVIFQSKAEIDITVEPILKGGEILI